MLVAVKTPTPSLPITSRQLQHLQAVTHSFAQRRPIISFVFNNFRTLSVATGGGTLCRQAFRGFRVGGFRSPFFSCCYKLSFFSERPALPGEVSFNLTCPSALCRRTSECAAFSGGKSAKFSRDAVPIQCCISPFNARKHRSEKGLEPYRQLR